MPSHWQYAATVGPLALYLYLLARWHGGRHPRVVSGPADFGLLALGLGGLVLFGPFGQTLARVLFGKPTPLGWMTMASGLALVAVLGSRRAWRRLVVYHVEPAVFERVLVEALANLPGRFQRTVSGFEDPARARGIVVDASPRWRTGTIEAYGGEPERLIQELEAGLRLRFRTMPVPPTRVGWGLLALSTLALVLPSIVWILGQPQARAALRVFFERRPG